MAGYIVFHSKLSQKDQLIALGYGGSAMPLEGACAESFASLLTAFWQTLLFRPYQINYLFIIRKV